MSVKQKLWSGSSNSLQRKESPHHFHSRCWVQVLFTYFRTRLSTSSQPEHWPFFAQHLFILIALPVPLCASALPRRCSYSHVSTVKVRSAATELYFLLLLILSFPPENFLVKFQSLEIPMLYKVTRHLRGIGLYLCEQALSGLHWLLRKKVVGE